MNPTAPDPELYPSVLWERARVLVVETGAHAQTLAERMRSCGAKVGTIDAGAQRIEEAGGLDPQCVLVDRSTGADISLLEAVLRTHLRLRWATLVDYRWDRLAPGGSPEMGLVADLLRPYTEVEQSIRDAATSRVKDIDLPLITIGPSRVLRAVADLTTEILQIEVADGPRRCVVEVGSDLVVGAAWWGTEDSVHPTLNGIEALAAFLTLAGSRATMERHEKAGAMTIMAPLDIALRHAQARLPTLAKHIAAGENGQRTKPHALTELARAMRTPSLDSGTLDAHRIDSESVGASPTVPHEATDAQFGLPAEDAASREITVRKAVDLDRLRLLRREEDEFPDDEPTALHEAPDSDLRFDDETAPAVSPWDDDQTVPGASLADSKVPADEKLDPTRQVELPNPAASSSSEPDPALGSNSDAAGQETSAEATPQPHTATPELEVSGSAAEASELAAASTTDQSVAPPDFDGDDTSIDVSAATAVEEPTFDEAANSASATADATNDSLEPSDDETGPGPGTRILQAGRLARIQTEKRRKKPKRQVQEVQVTRRAAASTSAADDQAPNDTADSESATASAPAPQLALDSMAASRKRTGRRDSGKGDSGRRKSDSKPPPPGPDGRPIRKDGAEPSRSAGATRSTSQRGSSPPPKSKPALAVKPAAPRLPRPPSLQSTSGKPRGQLSRSPQSSPPRPPARSSQPPAPRSSKPPPPDAEPRGSRPRSSQPPSSRPPSSPPRRSRPPSSPPRSSRPSTAPRSSRPPPPAPKGLFAEERPPPPNPPTRAADSRAFAENASASVQSAATRAVDAVELPIDRARRPASDPPRRTSARVSSRPQLPTSSLPPARSSSRPSSSSASGGSDAVSVPPPAPLPREVQSGAGKSAEVDLTALPSYPAVRLDSEERAKARRLPWPALVAVAVIVGGGAYLATRGSDDEAERAPISGDASNQVTESHRPNPPTPEEEIAAALAEESANPSTDEDSTERVVGTGPDVTAATIETDESAGNPNTAHECRDSGAYSSAGERTAKPERTAARRRRPSRVGHAPPQSP